MFFFKGNKNNKFSIHCAGGGFSYVGAIQDSFPHALELSKQGYNAFALIYRPNSVLAVEDLKRAISFIFDNSEQLEVSTDDYSLWGGSAGGRMVASIGSYGLDNYPKPAACIIQYTNHTDYNPQGEVATYVNVGESDGIASYHVMKERIDRLNQMNVKTEYHSYPGLSHGYGLGVGTIAEGWINQAIEFWKSV